MVVLTCFFLFFQLSQMSSSSARAKFKPWELCVQYFVWSDNSRAGSFDPNLFTTWRTSFTSNSHNSTATWPFRRITSHGLSNSFAIHLYRCWMRDTALHLRFTRKSSATSIIWYVYFYLYLCAFHLHAQLIMKLIAVLLLFTFNAHTHADYQKLMVVGECITALLFPFVWPHVYAPILPVALHHFLDAPVPFVMGLHADSESYLKIGNEATLCCVDIDKKTIQLPEELPLFPHRSDFIAEISAILDKFNVNYRDKSVRDAIQSMSSQMTNTNSSIASTIFSSRVMMICAVFFFVLIYQMKLLVSSLNVERDIFIIFLIRF